MQTMCSVYWEFLLKLLNSQMCLFSDEQVNTERAIRHAIQERLPIVVVINKVVL